MPPAIPAHPDPTWGSQLAHWLVGPAEPWLLSTLIWSGSSGSLGGGKRSRSAVGRRKRNRQEKGEAAWSVSVCGILAVIACILKQHLPNLGSTQKKKQRSIIANIGERGGESTRGLVKCKHRRGAELHRRLVQLYIFSGGCCCCCCGGGGPCRGGRAGCVPWQNACVPLLLLPLWNRETLALATERSIIESPRDLPTFQPGLQIPKTPGQRSKFHPRLPKRTPLCLSFILFSFCREQTEKKLLFFQYVRSFFHPPSYHHHHHLPPPDIIPRVREADRDCDDLRAGV